MENIIKIFLDKLLTSSEDANKLSARIQGTLMAFSGLILGIATQFGFVILDGQFQAVVAQIGMTAGTLYAIFGVLRWVVNTLGNKYLVEFGWGKKEDINPIE